MLIPFFPTEISSEFMFMTPDSQEYLETGTEFIDFSAIGFSETRPFLYPFALKLFNSIGGHCLVWIVQLFLWILSVNLIFVALKKILKNIVLYWLGSVLYAANLSLLALTFHGLTEVSTAFLLCVLIYQVSSSLDKIFNPNGLTKIYFNFVLLTLVKPLFFIPTLVLLIILLTVYARNHLFTKRQTSILLIFSLPLIFQLTVMKVKYDDFTVSKISSLTFERYFLTQGIELKEKCSREEALEIAHKMDNSEMKEYLLNNFNTYSEVYASNLSFNLNGYPQYLDMHPTFKNKQLLNFMISYNSWIDWLFYKCLIILGIFSAIALFKNQFYTHLGIVAIALLYYFCVFSSAISSYQGDRLIVFALPLTIVFYLYLLKGVFLQIKSFKNEIWRN